MSVVYIDFETRSMVDLKKLGTFRYVEDESTEIICLAYSIDAQSPLVWIPSEPFPDELSQSVSDGALFYAHNALFDLAIWNVVLCQLCAAVPELPVSQVRDTMAMAAAYGLERKLELVGGFLKLPQQKDTAGTALINKLSKPDSEGRFNSDPVLLNKFYDYCRQDVLTLISLAKALPDLTGSEQKVWEATALMNIRGVPLDVKSAKALSSLVTDEQSRLSSQFNELTGLNPTQTVAFRSWLNSQGCGIPDLKAATIAEYVSRTSGETQEALRLRQQASNTSNSKFQKMLDMVSADGALKGQFAYYGASTGRFSSRGINLQNLARPIIKGVTIENVLAGNYDGPDKLLTIVSCLRSVICAPEGKVFLDVDFSSIENRIGYWLIGDEGHLQLYIDGEDEYRVFASTMFSKPANEVTADERQAAKPAVLGCLYGAGPNAYKTSAKDNYGLDISDQDARVTVDQYRNTHPIVVGAWGNCEEAALLAVEECKIAHYRDITFDGTDDDVLKITLPSGRNMVFHEPYIGVSRFGRPVLIVMMVSSKTGRLEETELYGSKIFQNIVQAVARDILVDAMLRIPAEVGKVVATFHDEILVLADDQDAENQLVAMREIMRSAPAWAEGLPLDTDDGWAEKRFKK